MWPEANHECRSGMPYENLWKGTTHYYSLGARYVSVPTQLSCYSVLPLLQPSLGGHLKPSYPTLFWCQVVKVIMTCDHAREKCSAKTQDQEPSRVSESRQRLRHSGRRHGIRQKTKATEAVNHILSDPVDRSLEAPQHANSRIRYRKPLTS